MKGLFLVLYFIGVFFFNGKLSAKARILTFHFNKPDFLELQIRTCKKFLVDDYELIVFNDAPNPDWETAIQKVCDQNGILCVRYQPEWHLANPLNQIIEQWLEDPINFSHVRFPPKETPMSIANQPSIRHCHVIQYALDHYGYDHDDIVVLLDGDAFPIRPISLSKWLNGNPIIGIQKLIVEESIDYLWVPFIAFNPHKLPHVKDLKFNVSLINHTMYDTGAESYYYLKNNPSVLAKKILGYSSTGFHHWEPYQLKSYDFNDNEIWLIKNLPWPNCVEFHMNHHILHFGASSFSFEGYNIKSNYTKFFLRKILHLEASSVSESYEQ